MTRRQTSRLSSSSPNPFQIARNCKQPLILLLIKKSGWVIGFVVIVPNGLSWLAPMRKRPLQSRLASKQSMLNRFTSLQANLSLDFTPERIECFDISHTGGEGTVGSCVVFDQNGPIKSDYRRFNVAGITPGDDYAAMEQVLDRRFTRLSKGEGKIPSVLLIDGGKGQLTQAKEILEKHQFQRLYWSVSPKELVGGQGKKHCFLSSERGSREIAMKTESPGLHLLQQIRDEAHRFAITGHRQRRSRARRVSNLESIPGLGRKEDGSC